MVPKRPSKSAPEAAEASRGKGARDAGDPLSHTLSYSERAGAPRIEPGGAAESTNVETAPTKVAENTPAPSGGPDRSGASDDSRVGHHRIVEEHARGGLGRVLKATDVDLGREVALKEMLSGRGPAQERFLREAKITARLQHPAIVPIYELGVRPDGRPYYTMKMIRGESLRTAIKGAAGLGQRMALVPKLQAVADAMAYAHSHRVIHRDLKPANVVCGEFGETVVIDWGLAKDLTEESGPPVEEGPYRDSASEGLTVEGAVLGTPAYMPPEQARGEAVDETADVYALGAILYHLVSGETPYARTRGSSVVLQVLDGPPESLETLSPSAPPDLVAIAKRAMAREPGDRYQTAKEFAADLRSYLTGGLVGARRYTVGELALRWLGNHKAIALSTLAALAAVAVIGGFSINRVITERDAARKARVAAVDRTNELILSKARDALDSDPTEAIAWLKTYPDDGKDWRSVQHIAADAESRGIARYVLEGHQAAIRHIAVSGNGRLAVTYGVDTTVWLWDLDRGSGNKIGEKVYWDGAKMSFVADGSHVAVGTDKGDIMILSTRGAPERRLEGHKGTIWHLQHTRDTRHLVSAGEDGTVRLWDLRDGAHRVLTTEDAAVILSRLSPDERLLGVCDRRQRLSLIELATGTRRRLGDCVPNNARAYAMQFSPDNRLFVAGSSKGKVLVWDIRAGKGRTFDAGSGIVHDARLSPGGRWLAAAVGGRATHVWNLETGSEVRRVVGCGYHVAFSDDDRFLACAGQSGDIELRELTGHGEWTLRGQHAGSMGVVFLPDRRGLVSVGYGGDVRVWRMPALAPRFLGTHARKIRRMRYSPDGTWIATGGDDGQVALSHTSDASKKRHVQYDLSILGVGFSPHHSRHLVAGDGKGGVHVWDTELQRSRTLGRHPGVVTSVQFSPDGRHVLSTGLGGALWLWDVSDDAGSRKLASGAPLEAAAFSPDGSVIAASTTDGEIYLYAGQGEPKTTLRGHTALVYRVAFSPNGRHLASVSGDGTARVWSVLTGESRTVARHRRGARALVWIDRKTVASGGADGRVVVASATGDVIAELRGHAGEIWGLAAFGAELLASAADDGTLRLWWLHDYRTAALRASSHGLTTIDISPNGRFVAAGDKQGRLFQWDVRAIKPPPPAPDALRRWLDSATSVKSPTE